MCGRHAESKLRCASSVELPFASLCFDYTPARPPAWLGPEASSPRDGRAGFSAHSRHSLPQGPETFPGAREGERELTLSSRSWLRQRIFHVSQLSSRRRGFYTRGHVVVKGYTHAHKSTCRKYRPMARGALHEAPKAEDISGRQS